MYFKINAPGISEKDNHFKELNYLDPADPN